MTIREFLRYRPLPDRGETELLLAAAIKRERTYLISHNEATVPTAAAQKFSKLVARRQRGEPMAYLLGRQPFYGLNFTVNRHVLIPRPESEWLVERGLATLRANRRIRTVIDVGTGSGCLIISLLKNLTSAERQQLAAYATDSSKKALAVARHNAKQHKIKTIKFLHGNLLNPLAPSLMAYGLPMLRSATQGEQATSSLVLLLANLPYGSAADYRRTSLSIRKYEPKQAIFAGSDGLKYYRRLVTQLAQFPNIEFHCLWEIDPCHVQKLASLVRKYFPHAQPQMKPPGFTPPKAGFIKSIPLHPRANAQSIHGNLIKKDLNGLNRYLLVVIPRSREKRLRD